MAATPQPAGCVRVFLILILILVALSGGFLWLNLNSGKFLPPEAGEEWVAFTHVRVFTGEDTLAGLTTVVMAGDSVVCIGDGCKVSSVTKKIDGKGGALMPALADAAFFFYLPTKESFDLSPQDQFFDYLKQRPDVRRSFLQYGVGAFLSPGDIPGNLRELKKQLAKDQLAGPAVWMGGPFFTAPGGHPVGDWFAGDEELIKQACVEVKDESGARKAFATLQAEGTDGVSVIYDAGSDSLPVMSTATLAALITEAHNFGLWATVRVGTPSRLREAVNYKPEVVYYTGTAVPDTATLRLVRASGMLICLLPSMPEAGFHPDSSLVSAFLSAGIPLVTGSGWQTDLHAGEGLLANMRLLLKAGAAPLPLLRANTRQLYQTLHQDHLGGWIEPGHRTDLVLLNSIPWKSDTLDWNVRLMLWKGRVME